MDDFTKAALTRARTLIEQKKFDEAYKLLETVDHPTAEKWRDQLQPRLKPHQRRNTVLKLALLIALLIIGAIAVSSIIENDSQIATIQATFQGIFDSRDATRTARP